MGGKPCQLADRPEGMGLDHRGGHRLAENVDRMDRDGRCRAAPVENRWHPRLDDFDGFRCRCLFRVGGLLPSDHAMGERSGEAETEDSEGGDDRFGFV